jgi:cyclic pyranopterin phosphate synthase
VGCGIRRIRLTGGEPLVRKDICRLVAKLASIEGLEELALTTNGLLLAPMAGQLQAAGLKRINVSVDALERESYRTLTGRDCLAEIMSGIRKSIEVGLAPVRINSVILRGRNDSQITALAALTTKMPVTVRFIEYCPTSRGSYMADAFVPSSEVRQHIEREFGPLRRILSADGAGPAMYYRIESCLGEIGFISGRSSVFCNSCNRIRLTSEGKLKPCLYAARTYDLRSILRSGAGDGRIVSLLNEVIADKSNYTRLDSTRGGFCMRKIGG